PGYEPGVQPGAEALYLLRQLPGSLAAGRCYLVVEPDMAGVEGGKILKGPDEPAAVVEQLVLPGGELLQQSLQRFQTVAQAGLKEVLLVGVVLVQHPHAHPGLPGDGGHARAVEALLGKELYPRFQ